jgi:DNA-binding transcriptional MerR regulator
LNKNVFTREELLARTLVSEEILGRWIREKLVRPAGYTDDRRPLFSEETAARLANILKLQELGYGPDEIQKIIKKIGLPRTREERAGNGNLDKYLTVGNIAERAGVSPRTIKHWEDKGIIEPDMRSEGGFRLYSKGYVHLCKLIQDLQLFGYTLEEIKTISDYFRDFLAFQERLEAFDKDEVAPKIEAWLDGLQALSEKMRLFREGMERWEVLMKKKKKEILNLKAKNQKRRGVSGGG